MNRRTSLALARLLPLGVLSLAALAGCDHDTLPTALAPDGAVFTQLTSSSGPVVNSLEDGLDAYGCTESHCTLREAINFAEAGATITFSVTGTIYLTDGALVIDKDLTIQGPAAGITLDAAMEGQRVMTIWPPSLGAPGPTVFLSGMTFTGGEAGAIYSSHGVLTIEDMVISGNINEFGPGGGISSWGGTVNILNTTVSNNGCENPCFLGGGIYITDGAALSVSESTISGNYASSGGGIYNRRGRATVTRSTVTANSVTVFGGGIASFTSDADFASEWTSISNTTISGNTAGMDGGGLNNSQGLTRILHSTVTGNQGASGGGVYSHNVTGDQTEVMGSIIWGNTNGTGDDDLASGSSQTHGYNSLGYNLIGAAGAYVDFTSEFNASGDQTGVADAGLGPLALNSPGTTATHALDGDSPAIDMIPTADCSVATDQRGVSRPQGSACDIGAFEREATAGQSPGAPVVNSLDDVVDTDGCTESHCSLREAITFADVGATITFSVTGTITLTQGQLTIEKNLTITGPGASSLTVSGNNSSREFLIDRASVAISGLTVTGGQPPLDPGSVVHGGGIYVMEGTLALDLAVVKGNRAHYGGGISADWNSTVTITRSTISGNTAVPIDDEEGWNFLGEGGGVSNINSTVTIEASTVTGNQARNGGGIHSTGGGAPLSGTAPSPETPLRSVVAASTTSLPPGSFSQPSPTTRPGATAAVCSPGLLPA